MGDILTILDKIAGVITQTCVIEYDKKFNKLVDINSSYTLDLEETIKEDRVTYTVVGDFGKDINNPDISFIFMEELNKDTLPELKTLVGQVKNYYITLKLLSLTKEG